MRSMTGYGAGAVEGPTARLTVEIRSVNQRFIDVKVTAPREYGAWEAEIRERVRTVAQRGRIDVTVARTPIAARRRYTVAVRAELARSYVQAARELARGLKLDGAIALADVLRLPDLFEVSERGAELRRELPALRRALKVALRNFDAERRREGRHLRQDMRRRTVRLRRLTGRMRRRLPHTLRVLRRRVEGRLRRLAGADGLDAGRVAQEVAVLADRSDITEELVRLESHLAALTAALRDPAPVGKRVEFLLQEIHRELNTVGSKAGDRLIGSLVLVAKGEAEKLREQVQNVE